MSALTTNSLPAGCIHRVMVGADVRHKVLHVHTSIHPPHNTHPQRPWGSSSRPPHKQLRSSLLWEPPLAGGGAGRGGRVGAWAGGWAGGQAGGCVDIQQTNEPAGWMSGRVGGRVAVPLPRGCRCARSLGLFTGRCRLPAHAGPPPRPQSFPGSCSKPPCPRPAPPLVFWLLPSPPPRPGLPRLAPIPSGIGLRVGRIMEGSMCIKFFRPLRRHGPPSALPWPLPSPAQPCPAPLARHAGLREACERDIGKLCADEKEQIELTEGAGADSQVLTCLEVWGRGTAAFLWLGTVGLRTALAEPF